MEVSYDLPIQSSEVAESLSDSEQGGWDQENVHLAFPIEKTLAPNHARVVGHAPALLASLQENLIVRVPEMLWYGIT